jgi:KDO2-lipid IV(A) lauroyltransferase
LYQPNIPQNKKSFQWFVFPWFWGISKLPWIIINAISSIVYVILYRVLKYRLKVVQENLKRSFPNHTAKDLKKIEEGYYRHLSDLMLETIKGFSLTKKQISNRVYLENKELLDDFFQNGKSALVILSHSGNWEWSCLAASYYTQMPFYVVYKPLSNAGFNSFFYKMRSKYGAHPISMNETLRMVSQNAEKSYFLAMVGDQNPGNINNVHWDTFLNQETAFLNGPAKIAERYQLPVIYLKSKKTKRHQYTLIPELIVDWENFNSKPTNLEFEHLSTNNTWKANSIMNQIIKYTESEILEQPEIWLWSHRRWKHKRNK